MEAPADNRSDIRDFLVSRRAKLAPERVGLPAGGRRRVPGLRREDVTLPPSVQWMLDSMTMAPAFVRDGRLDIVASNALCRAVYAPMFASTTTADRGRANFARYFFLDPGSQGFFVDWEDGARATVAVLRAEAGREPHDQALRELVGELSTLSPGFRAMWAGHDVRIRHEGGKRLDHPEAGRLEMTFRHLDLPLPQRAVHDLIIYTAEPGTPTEERLKLLASWTAPTGRR